MASADAGEVTRLLVDVRNGKKDAAEQVFAVVYKELRRLAGYYMQAERQNHTLQPTALVHEAYLKLLGAGPIDWQDRAHFFAVAAKQMRNVLVDHARAVKAEKRGGEAVKVCLDDAEAVAAKPDEDILEIDEALTRLEGMDARAAHVVELKFFSGLTDKEVAEIIGVALPTVRRDWEFARAWLYSQLGGKDSAKGAAP